MTEQNTAPENVTPINTQPEPAQEQPQPQQQNSGNDAMAMMMKSSQANAEYEAEAKSSGPMWLLWWFTGAIGGHRYYLGDTGYALAMTFTLGGIGFWALADAFIIGKRLKTKNAEKRREIFARHGLPA